MKIAIAADHGGVELKDEIVKYLKEKGIEYKDFGTQGNTAVDYPDMALPVALGIKSGEFDKGILVCGTGIGISIAANKIPGIRCALLGDVFSAKATREHNDSQIMALGGRVTGPGLAIEIVQAFLDTPFSQGQRHKSRLDKITEIEKTYCKEN